MTLDDLTKIFLDGNGQAYCSTKDRIRAVVEALRDEMTRLRYSHGSLAAFDTLDEILASEGVEAAGTDTAVTETKPEAIERSAPAAAPDVCPRCGYPAQEQCDAPECRAEAAR